ncbi:DNA internalization-related competence protein ComEC/Rec2 [hydrothermal vent metagenome]|uniref:DNA internalization-related competence protein ComEC/Rec2 n=1 Tax=hydrothermal vent metagenome TaxID=652676 RepID=A0A3B0TRA0_9ZZZZ
MLTGKNTIVEHLQPQLTLLRKNRAMSVLPEAFGRFDGDPLKQKTPYFIRIVSTALAKRRLLIAQPFAMVLGILAYRSARFEPSPYALGAVMLAIVMTLFIVRRSGSLLPAIALVLGFWAGFSLLYVNGALFGTNMLYGVVYGKFSARVDAIHSNDGQKARLIISNIVPLEKGARAPPLRRARIMVPADNLADIGDIISASMRLYKVPGPVVPGGYDSQFHSYFDGIGAFGSATGPVSLLKRSGEIDFFRFVADIRTAIGKRIDLTLKPPAAAIARALIIGDQGQIDQKVRANLAAAGLAHVLAISGLHLSLVAGGVFAAMRMLLCASYVVGQRLNVKKTAAIFGIAAALIYLALSGAGVSAIRATLMLLLVFGAVLAGRRALTMRNVAFAAIFVILVDPSSVFRPGFQLSFAAVIALIGVYEGYRGDLAPIAKGWFKHFLHTFGTIALTSLIAGAATALFAAYHFQQTAPLGVLGNIVAIPIVAFVVLPSALISVLLMPFGFEPLFLKIMGWGIERIIDLAAYVSSLSAGMVSAPLLNPYALLIGFAALAWFAFFEGRERFVSLPVALVLLILFATSPSPDILVADSTKAIAVRQSDGLALISGRANSFAVRAWSKAYIEPIAARTEEKSCDIVGCYITRDRFSLALVKTRDGFEEDCQLADLVITRIKAPQSCSGATQVIDKSDLEQKGVHWGFWTGDKFMLRAAITDIFRPWRPKYPDR